MTEAMQMFNPYYKKSENKDDKTKEKEKSQEEVVIKKTKYETIVRLKK